MTAHQQLNTLYKLFPRATELAVSPELRYQFESEMVANIRFCAPASIKPFVWVHERLQTIIATRLPLAFKDKRLTLVEPIA